MSTRGLIVDKRKMPFKHYYIAHDAYPEGAGIDIERMRQGMETRMPGNYEPISAKEAKDIGGEYRYTLTSEETRFDEYSKDECDPFQEYVSGYIKKDGTIVHGFCRDKYNRRPL